MSLNKAKLLYLAVASAFLLIGCKGNNGLDPDSPAFGNATTLGDGKVYVAYPFRDQWKKKLDTVSLSFDCNESKVQSISVSATIDSGRTWLPIATIAPAGSKTYTVCWTPKSSADFPKYFGIKRCFIRIADTVTDQRIDSDTFPLAGAVPLVLLKSLDNDTFHMSDTIKVQYGANMDMASHIQTYFRTESMENWVEFRNDSKLPSPDAPLIQNLQRCFIPDAVDSTVKIEARNFIEPIKILLKDYSSTSPDCVFQTGEIYIVP
jgi:hypothetical protein